MKIYTYSTEEGLLWSVKVFDKASVTDEEIADKVKSANEKAGREAYKLFDVPENMEEIILFLMGEKDYKRYADIDNLEDTMETLDNDIYGLSCDISDIVDKMESIKRTFNEIKENLKS